MVFSPSTPKDYPQPRTALIPLQIAPQRTLLIEPDPAVCLSIRRSFQTHPQLRLIGQIMDGGLGMETLLQTKPDLVVLNADLPILTTVAPLQALRLALPTTRILLLTRHKVSYDAIAPFLGWADAYCVRQDNYKKLLVAIACIQDGGTYLDPEIACPVFSHASKQTTAKQNTLLHHQPSASFKLPAHHLSARELEVLQLVVEGHSNPEIAAKLYLSLSTVKAHLRNIMSKLAVDDRVQVAVTALRAGLVSLPCCNA